MKIFYSINKNCINLTKYCKIEYNRTFWIQATNFFHIIKYIGHIINFSTFSKPLPCLKFMPTMPPNYYPIISIINLSAKSSNKQLMFNCSLKLIISDLIKFVLILIWGKLTHSSTVWNRWKCQVCMFLSCHVRISEWIHTL